MPLMRDRGPARHDLDALREVYAAADALLAGLGCARSTDCCRFARTGREPYLWPIEWALLERAIAELGVRPRSLELGDERACPLLGADGGCLVYGARPFGCRTFFCARARARAGRLPRAELAALGRRIAALAGDGAADRDGPRRLGRFFPARR